MHSFNILFHFSKILWHPFAVIRVYSEHLHERNGMPDLVAHKTPLVSHLGEALQGNTNGTGHQCETRV